jgi:hypothetical protein
MGHADHTTPGRYCHQLDAQYLKDARALSEYLRRAYTPSRVEPGARTNRGVAGTSPMRTTYSILAGLGMLLAPTRAARGCDLGRCGSSDSSRGSP